MSNEEEHRAGLVPSQSVALSPAGATSLVHRGVQDLLARAEAEEWYQRGLSLWAYELYPADVAAERKARQEAAECFRRGLQLDPNHPALQFAIGCAHLVDGEPEGDYTEAVAWWRKAAEQGYVSAQSHLEAIEGDAEAQFIVGATWGHKNTFGVISFAQALVWYRMAAKQGHAAAQINLGRFYEVGHAVGRDSQQAEYWYRKAAEQGDAQAQLNLGEMHAEGEGVPQDYAEAEIWLRTAAHQGDERERDALEDVLSKIQDDQDFFIEDGVIAYGRRGRQLMSAFYELIKGTLPAITVAFDGREGDEGSYLARGKDAALGAAIQFCISVLWEPARAHYGARLGSLFVDALFARFYGRLPHDELFQMYMDCPLFPGQDKGKSPTKPGRLPGNRISQFIFDIVGHPDIAPFILLQTTVGQLMLDGKAVFDSQDSEKIATDLVQTLFPRLTKRLDKPHQKFPIS